MAESARAMRLPGSVAEVAASPDGRQIGAFFDVDGTLVAGFTASVYAKDRMRRREVGVAELARTVQLGVNYRLGRTGFEQLLDRGTRQLCGQRLDALDELGERLFQTSVADLLYPEMRELVRAHQARGHTVAVSSSALPHQIEPIARCLGIDNVLCNRFDVDDDGVLTGLIVKPIIWGAGKSSVVQHFAAENGIDIRHSYFYADGDEDLPLMYAVGHPRPTNPGKSMERVAARRGWPVLKFDSRGAKGAGHRIRSLAGVASVLPIGAAGVGVGLLARNRRRGVNVVTSVWPGAMLAINGVKVNVIGEQNLTAQRPAVFLFNHRNNFDAFIAASLVKTDFTGVAKKELQGNLVFGTIGRLADAAFIDRNDSRSAVAALQEITKLAEQGISILISPEGTRLDTTSVGPFKKGAFHMALAAQIPIVPIVIRNAETVAGRNAASLNPGTVDVAVLKPIPTQGWTRRELSKKVDEVHRLYVDTLADWPVS